jgi:hypothetical protein
LTITVDDLSDTIRATSDSSTSVTTISPVGELVTITDLLLLPPLLTHTIFLLGPTGTVSDIASLTVAANGALTFAFLSDTGEVPLLVPPPGAVTVNETGEFQDISALLSAPSGVTILVRSDLEAVPEPTSFVLFGTTLAGLLSVYGWQRRKGKSTRIAG